MILLGRRVPANADFASRINSIPRFTYRKNFSPLPNGLNSDKGWGCCIRSGQGLIAQFIQRYRSENPAGYSKHFNDNYLPYFYDTEQAEFGIHAFCREIGGQSQEIGKWVKSSELAVVIGRLLGRHGIHVSISHGGMIARSELSQFLQDGTPVLVLLPMMLGVPTLDASFETFVKLSVSLTLQAVGIVGGQQGRSYFLVGYQQDDFLLFDPHEIRPAVLGPGDESDFFASDLKRVKRSQLNSSMLVGFYVSSMSDLEEIPVLTAGLAACPLSIVDDLPRESEVETFEVEDDWNMVGNSLC
jgi:cysteine protease ATG4